ncbi:MAG: glycosyltransferase, partial [Gemmatimonadota bacterium]|nr:glycosyltransferase [Gemmatimonadota bacterium]
VVDPGWLRASVALFMEDPSVTAVTGLVVPHELETDAQNAFEDHRGFANDFARSWYRVDRAAGERAAAAHGAAGKFGTGANMAYRTRVFREIGGFDPALDVGTATRGGGDLEMFFRVLKEGHTLVREPSAVVRHRHRRSYPELRRQLSTWGVGMQSYIVRSWLAYPDERVGLAWLALRWTLLRNARRLARSLRGSTLRRELVWDEMKYGPLAPLRYRQARRRVRELEGAFGPSPVAVSGTGRAGAARRHRGSPVARRMDLVDGVGPLTDVADASSVTVEVYWAGEPLGTVSLAPRGAPICASRLRDAMVERCGERLVGAAGLSVGALRAALEARWEGCRT